MVHFHCHDKDPDRFSRGNLEVQPQRIVLDVSVLPTGALLTQEEHHSSDDEWMKICVAHNDKSVLLISSCVP